VKLSSAARVDVASDAILLADRRIGRFVRRHWRGRIALAPCSWSPAAKRRRSRRSALKSAACRGLCRRNLVGRCGNPPSADADCSPAGMTSGGLGHNGELVGRLFVLTGGLANGIAARDACRDGADDSEMKQIVANAMNSPKLTGFVPRTRLRAVNSESYKKRKHPRRLSRRRPRLNTYQS